MARRKRKKGLWKIVKVSKKKPKKLKGKGFVWKRIPKTKCWVKFKVR